ncbi:MAG: FAD-binding oxidoreductase [Myxococcota bacterium]
MSGDLAAIARALSSTGARVHEAPAPRWSADFGRVERAAPGLVVEARCEDDVAATLAQAHGRGIPVTLRGTGHSCNGSSLSRGGILLVNAERSAPPPELLPDGRVRVAGRQRWREVERALHRRGRQVPVLADFLRLSVGGTLAVGGYGVDSVRQGALVDQVEALRLVLPDGRRVTCSPDADPELFRFGLAGLGRVGAIESALLRTEPLARITVLFTYRHPGLEEMIDSLGWLAQPGGKQPAFFRALHARGRFVSTYGVAAASLGDAARAVSPVPARRPAHRFVCPAYRTWRSRAVALWTARFGGARRVWCDYVFDYQGLRGFARHLAARLADDAFAGCLQSAYVLAVRRPAGRARFALEAGNTPGDGPRFGIGLYCMVPAGDDAALAQVRAAQEDCLRACQALGGRPYLYGAHRLGRERLDAVYGADYARVRELSRELDPRQTFQTGALD